MELFAMVYERMISSEKLKDLLASYDARAAVFHQQAASSDDCMWGDTQFPRVDYAIDMMENPARNSNGVLSINVWCDTQSAAMPEDIEPVIRELFHSAFVNAEEEIFCFAWVRSDVFDGTVEHNTRTIGVSLRFDIMACPCQYTMYPDPIKAMNLWTKKVLPNAVVLGEDEIDGWVLPSREQPVVYWRLAAQGTQQKHFTHTWLNITIEGHVYARTAADRLFNLVRLNTAAALAGHIPMEDTSPLFLKGYTCKPHLNYLSQGQIQTNGTFGILQPQSHLESHSTGETLRNATPTYIYSRKE